MLFHAVAFFYFETAEKGSWCEHNARYSALFTLRTFLVYMNNIL